MKLALQTILLGFILLLAVWVRLPLGAAAGFGLVAAALVFRALAPLSVRAWIDWGPLAAAWAGTLAIWISAALAGIALDVYYSALAGLMAGAIWLSAGRVAGAVWKARWDSVVMAWLMCGALICLGAGYFRNQRSPFYAGLLAMLALLALCRRWFRWGAAGAQVLNTLILLLVALPLADLARWPHSRAAVRPETCRLYYSFDAAKGDPQAFERWEEFYQLEFDRMGRDLFIPAANLPFGLRPGGHAFMMSCPVSINSLGFRGPEISRSKEGFYRIVALGESTTFGMTIQPGDAPWPEMLEEIIRQRLKTRRPVQVINAGVPAYGIRESLCRLPREILPLRPDMIICYHGANGFNLLDASALPPLGPPPPVYQDRPIKLLADAEHRGRMLLFAYLARRRHSLEPPPAAGPLKTQYAAAYRQLIECAGTNGVRLALANFSMAVNRSSDQAVIDFYQGGGIRAAYAFIRANALHSSIVSHLAAEHQEVCLVDTHPHLDGEHEKFIDLIHLTNEGRRQLAENIFAGIRQTLQHDLDEK